MMARDTDAPIRLLLVEDHAAFRQAMAVLFGREPDFVVVAEAGTLEGARKHLHARFDLALLDMTLPDGVGVDFIEELRHDNLQTPVLVLSATLGQENIQRTIEAGASGIVDKLSGLEKILSAARSLHRGAVPISLKEVTTMMRPAGGLQHSPTRDMTSGVKSLSQSETQALQALANGLDDADVAHRLGISIEEGNELLGGILTRLGARSRLHALYLAAREGAVEIAVR